MITPLTLTVIVAALSALYLIGDAVGGWLSR